MSNIIDFKKIKMNKKISDDSLLNAQDCLEQMTTAFNWGMESLNSINTPNGFFTNYDAKLYTILNGAYNCLGKNMEEFLLEYKNINEESLLEYIKSYINIGEVVFIYDNKKHNYVFEIYYKDILISTMVFPYKIAYLSSEEELNKYETTISDLKNLLELREYQLKELSKNRLLKTFKRNEINFIKSRISDIKNDLKQMELEFEQTKAILKTEEFNLLLFNLKKFFIMHSIKIDEYLY